MQLINAFFSCSPLGTISSWVVIFILPINSALNPILYTLTTSFFREQVELLLCRWQRRHTLKKDRKSLTSSTIFVEAPRAPSYQPSAYLQQMSLTGMDPRYAWETRQLSLGSKEVTSQVLKDLKTFWWVRPVYTYFLLGSCFESL